MATQYPRYRMRDGQTRLAEGYFNPIWQDLDGRLNRIEALRVEWESAVAELAQFGVERLDAAVAPLVAEAQAQLAETETIGAQLAALVEDLDWTAHLTAELAEHSTTVQGWLDGAEERLDRTAPPDALTMTYDANGRVAMVSETLPSGTREHTYTYGAEGLVAEVFSTGGGITRTETYAYADGVLIGMTATEEPV